MIFQSSFPISRIIVAAVLFGPAFSLGPRSYYIFDAIIFGVILISSLTGKSSISKIDKKDLRVILFTACVLIVLAVIQQIFYHQVICISLFRTLFYAASAIIVGNIFPPSFIHKTQSIRVLLYVVYLIALMQLVDFYVFSNSLSINKFVSYLYPYAGDLSGKGMLLSQGLALKVSSFFTPSSSFDGQSILFGNFLAFSFMFSFFFLRKIDCIFPLVLSLLTFNRGSWLAIVVFVSSVFLLRILHLAQTLELRTLTFKRKHIFAMIFFLTILPLLLMSPIWISFVNYFTFTIQNTLSVFNIGNFGTVGSQLDPRTSKVWSNFFDSLNQSSDLSYIIGIPYSGPTDSGILHLFQISGILGLALLTFLIAHFISYRHRFSIYMPVILSYLSVSIFNPVHQGLRLVFLFFLACFLTRHAKIHHQTKGT